MKKIYKRLAHQDHLKIDSASNRKQKNSSKNKHYIITKREKRMKYKFQDKLKISM